MKRNKTYLVRKYALLLVCLYLIEALGNNVLSQFTNNIESSRDIAINVLIYSGLFYLLSIVLAIFVYNDIKSLAIQAKYAVLATVIFAPFGICLFLLYVILAEVEKIEEQAQGLPNLPDRP